MSEARYHEPPPDRGPRPPAPTPIRRPLNTGQAGCSTAALIARRQRYIDPEVRRLLGAAYVAGVVAEIDAALAERGRAA